MLGHFLRPGGAVQPDQRHIQRLNNRGRRRNIRPDQQGAGGLHRDLHENRRIRAGQAPGPLGTVHRRFDLQRVLTGFDQDRVHPAGDQPAALFGQRVLQRVIGDIAQARQLGARADAAHHPAMPPIGEAFRRFPRQFGGPHVQLKRPIAEIELRQGNGGGAEGVGFHHIRAGGEIATMDVAHQVWARQAQNIRAVLLPPVIQVDIQGQALHPASHPAIAQQHAVAEGIKQMGAGHARASKAGVSSRSGAVADHRQTVIGPATLTVWAGDSPASVNRACMAASAKPGQRCASR